MSSQEVVDFISEKIKPDQNGKTRALSSIVEEVSMKEKLRFYIEVQCSHQGLNNALLSSRAKTKWISDIYTVFVNN